MRNLNRIIIISLVLFATSVASYAKGSQQSNTKVSISRFDKDMLGYLDNPSKEKANQLMRNYPTLLPAFAQTITNTSNNQHLFEDLQKYFAHPMLKGIYKDAVNKFFDITPYEKELQIADILIQEQLGGRRLPKLSVHVSGFKENVIYTSDVLSLSIDKYMGQNYEGYKKFFKPYQLHQMRSELVARDFVKAWLMAEVIKTETTSGDLLFEMIEQGKLLYSLTILLPNLSEQDIVGYTAQQYNWCADNEKKIWNSIVTQNHLFTKDRHIITRYFSDSPYTDPAYKGAPVQIGAWVGFQMIKAYAFTSKKPLRDILISDVQTILKDSKYRP